MVVAPDLGLLVRPQVPPCPEVQAAGVAAVVAAGRGYQVGRGGVGDSHKMISSLDVDSSCLACGRATQRMYRRSSQQCQRQQQ
jgi:hypothetical protein